MGIKALRKVLFGRETTAGTAVATTTYWRGMGTIEDNREVVFPDEDIGYLSGTDRTYIPKYEATLELEGDTTFEQLPHFLDAGIATATATQDGTGSDYIYTYTFPTTAQPTNKTYTIEGGDDVQAEEMEYSYVEKISLKGAAGEAVNLKATWKGRQVTPTTYTTTATIPTVETMLFQKGRLYIDTAGGSFGATQKSNTLLGFTFDYSTGWTPVFTGDGNLYFSFIKVVKDKLEARLEITFEHDSTAVAEIAAWRAQTPRRIQLKIAGNNVTTAGTTYSAKTLIINVAGKWESFSKIDEQDGNDVVTGVLVGKYTTTASAFGSIIVVNEVSALP